jgi:hypothetical protein
MAAISPPTTLFCGSIGRTSKRQKRTTIQHVRRATPAQARVDRRRRQLSKRRVDFSAPVPPSKRAWVVPGIGAGWLRVLAQGEREAREAEAAAAAEAEAEEEAAAEGEVCR